MTIILLSGLTLLTACGVDGEPIPPTADADADVYITSRGVSVGTRLAIGQGPLRLNLGLGL